MKFLILPLLIVFSLSAGAKAKHAQPVKARELVKVEFMRGKSGHTYRLTQTPGISPVYTLGFKDEKGKQRSKVISARQSEALAYEATRLVWETQYRGPAAAKPAARKPCPQYARIHIVKDRATICADDARQVGRTFGFLNTLNQTMR